MIPVDRAAAKNAAIITVFMRPPILIALIAVMVPFNGAAEPASDAQMAREALLPYVSKDAAARARTLNRSRQELLMLAARTPHAIRPARVFFGAGVSAAELEDLSDRFGVEVMDVMVKAPEGDDGTIMSIQFGMQDLFATDGTLETRLSFAIGAEQKCFAKMSTLVPPDEAAAKADLAVRPFLVYSARVFGPAGSLNELYELPNVTAVMLNVRPGVIAEFEAAKAYDGPHRYFMPGFHC